MNTEYDIARLHSDLGSNLKLTLILVTVVLFTLTLQQSWLAVQWYGRFGANPLFSETASKFPLTGILLHGLTGLTVPWFL